MLIEYNKCDFIYKCVESIGLTFSLARLWWLLGLASLAWVPQNLVEAKL